MERTIGQDYELRINEPLKANTLTIDTTNADLLNDDDIVNRIRRALANFKGLVIENANMTIYDKDPDNIQIEITGNKIKIQE